MTQQDDAISTLEQLIETCRDGQNGYRDAAEHIKNTGIRTWFNQQSLEQVHCRASASLADRVGERPDRGREGRGDQRLDIIRADRIGTAVERQLVELVRRDPRLVPALPDGPVSRLRGQGAHCRSVSRFTDECTHRQG